MSGYLFVGGTRDGQRIMVDKPQVKLPINRVRSPFEPFLPCDTEIYVAVRLFRDNGNCEEFVVYALAGMRPSDVLNLLIQRYK